jgi:hypothetical protein
MNDTPYVSAPCLARPKTAKYKLSAFELSLMIAMGGG